MGPLPVGKQVFLLGTHEADGAAHCRRLGVACKAKVARSPYTVFSKVDRRAELHMDVVTAVAERRLTLQNLVAWTTSTANAVASMEGLLASQNRRVSTNPSTETVVTAQPQSNEKDTNQPKTPHGADHPCHVVLYGSADGRLLKGTCVATGTSLPLHLLIAREWVTSEDEATHLPSCDVCHDALEQVSHRTLQRGTLRSVQLGMVCTSRV